MKNVKFLLIDERYNDEYDTYVRSVASPDIPWVTLTDVEFNALMSNKWRFKQHLMNVSNGKNIDRFDIVVVTEPDIVDIKAAISDMMNAIIKEEEKKKADAEKRAERAEQNRLKKLAKTKEERQKLFNQLKKEFEE